MRSSAKLNPSCRYSLEYGRSYLAIPHDYGHMIDVLILRQTCSHLSLDHLGHYRTPLSAKDILIEDSLSRTCLSFVSDVCGTLAEVRKPRYGRGQRRSPCNVTGMLSW